MIKKKKRNGESQIDRYRGLLRVTSLHGPRFFATHTECPHTREREERGCVKMSMDDERRASRVPLCAIGAPFQEPMAMDSAGWKINDSIKLRTWNRVAPYILYRAQNVIESYK